MCQRKKLKNKQCRVLLNTNVKSEIVFPVIHAICCFKQRRHSKNRSKKYELYNFSIIVLINNSSYSLEFLY